MISDLLVSAGFRSVGEIWHTLTAQSCKLVEAIQGCCHLEGICSGLGMMMQEAAAGEAASTSQAEEGRQEKRERQKMAQILHAYFLAKYMQSDNLPCQIQEGLYLGSIGAAHNKAVLQQLGVSHVLIVANSVEPPFPQHFKYLRIDVLDNPGVNLMQHFSACFHFIDQGRQSGGVLVHCFAGKSRSVTVVLAYLMKTHKLKLAQALEMVKCKRPVASPNQGFMLQLHTFEIQCSRRSNSNQEEEQQQA